MAMAGSLAVLLTAPFFDLFVSPGPKICLRLLGLAQALLWTSQDHALTPSDCTQASQHCGCTKIFRRKHWNSETVTVDKSGDNFYHWQTLNRNESNIESLSWLVKNCIHIGRVPAKRQLQTCLSTLQAKFKKLGEILKSSPTGLPTANLWTPQVWGNMWASMP